MQLVTRLSESRSLEIARNISQCSVVKSSPSFLAIALLTACFYPTLSFAQVSATLSGVVTDSSGAAVPGALVVAKRIDTGISRTASTEQNGHYRFFALPVGVYEVTATKEGFAETIRNGIRLAVGQDANADLSLRVGQVKEQVLVTEDAPIVSLTTQDISGLVGEREVKDLPLNGRSYDLLLPLNPGIANFTSEKTGGIGVSNSTTGNNFAVSGQNHLSPTNN